MITIEREPSSTVLVRMRDCDTFGHLHNSSFIDYILDAREDHLKHYYNLDLFDYARTTGCGWVVSRHEIRYVRPAPAGSSVRIVTRLIAFDERMLVMEGRIHAEDSTLLALLWTTLRAVDIRSGRPAVHEQQRLMPLLADVCNPVEAPSLDERLAMLRARPQE